MSSKKRKPTRQPSEVPPPEASPVFAPPPPPPPDVPKQDPSVPAGLNEEDMENIRIQIKHRKDCNQIGEYSDNIFKYCILYRGYWYFIAFHTYKNQALMAIKYNDLSDAEKEKFLAFRERKEREINIRTAQDLKQS